VSNLHVRNTLYPLKGLNVLDYEEEVEGVRVIVMVVMVVTVLMSGVLYSRFE
jgi:hypothetical protein